MLLENESDFLPRLTDLKFCNALAISDHLGRNALHYAVLGEKRGIVEELCKTVPKLINQSDGILRTPLHIASKKGDIGLIDILVDNKAQLDVKDGYGRTPLHLAAMMDKTDSIKILLSKGAKFDSLDNLQRTPIYLAIRYDALSAVKVFLKGESLNIIVNKDNTEQSLHIAARYNSLNVLKFLCTATKTLTNGDEEKVNLNAQNKYGSTALHNAAYSGNPESVSILLKSGANIRAIDNQKRIPLELAIKRNDDLINTIDNKAAAEKKIQAAIKCCDGELLIRKVWSKYQIDYSTLSKIEQSCKLDKSNFLDLKVKEFILGFIPKVLKFLHANDQELCSVLDRMEESKEPLIIKIAKSGNAPLLKKYGNDLPEFQDILDQEQKDNLFKILNSTNLEGFDNKISLHTLKTQLLSNKDELHYKIDENSPKVLHKDIPKIHNVNDLYECILNDSFDLIKDFIFNLTTSNSNSNNVELLKELANLIATNSLKIESDDNIPRNELFITTMDHLELMGADVSDLYDIYAKYF